MDQRVENCYMCLPNCQSNQATDSIIDLDSSSIKYKNIEIKNKRMHLFFSFQNVISVKQLFTEHPSPLIIFSFITQFAFNKHVSHDSMLMTKHIKKSF